MPSFANTLQPDVFEQQLQTKKLGRVAIFRDQTESTQNEAQQASEENAPHGTVIIAESQRAGRGRMQRVWESRAHQGLYMSLLLRELPPPSSIHLLSLAVGLSTAQAIGAVISETRRTPHIKWPNDILLGNEKCAGILIETKLRSATNPLISAEGQALVGIGVNVYGNPWKISHDRQATTLEAALRTPTPENEASTVSATPTVSATLREETAAGILNELEPTLDVITHEKQKILEKVEKCLAWKGEQVSCGSVHGVLQGLDENGSLILREGEQKHLLHAGEIGRSAPLHRSPHPIDL